MLEEKIDIKNMIYEIRGKQVMLDSDLAKLYKVETKAFLQAVKRNIKRFPVNFMFQLTKEEFINLRSQFVTSSLNNNFGGRRYKIRVFTEQGVAMLATILKSKVATKVIRNNSFHDRYFIIDEKEIYHCGTSINNVGNKIFSINKLEDDCVKKSLIEIIGSLL